MKVALVAEQYPPTIGGIATSAQRLAQTLSDLGVEVRVLTFDNTRPVTSPSYNVIDSDGRVAVWRLGPFFLGQPREVQTEINEKWRASLRRQMVDQIVDLLSAEPPDVFLSFFLLNAGFVAQFVGAALAIPVVACVRGNDIGHNIFSVDRFAVTEWVIRRADAVVCVNEHLRLRLLWAWPEAGPKTKVIPNSVRIPPWKGHVTYSKSPARSDLGWPSGTIVAAFVGTLREKKGAAILLSALARLHDTDVRLLVIGPPIGPREQQACGTVWNDLLEKRRIFTTGLISRDLATAWARTADIVVMPSVDDGMANGLLEGMAVGLCPVVSDLFTDVITDEYDGVVVRRGDAHALATALRGLAADPSRRQRLSQGARARVASWTPEMEADAYLDVLETVSKVNAPRANRQATLSEGL